MDDSVKRVRVEAIPWPQVRQVEPIRTGHD